MTPSRILSGPTSMHGASAEARGKPVDTTPWWLCPPFNARRVFEVGSVLSPTVLAGETLVCAFQVPSGLEFAWTDIVIDFAGANWIQGAGEVTFQVDVNNPVGGAPQGYPVQGINGHSLLLGAFQVAPWPFRKAELLESEDIARIKVTNVSFGSTGAPNFFNAAIIGWTRPVPRL